MKKRATLGLVIGFLAIGTAFSSAGSMARLWLEKEAIVDQGTEVDAETIEVDETGRSTLRYVTGSGSIHRTTERPLPWGIGAVARVGESVSLWYDPRRPERTTTWKGLVVVRWLLAGLAVLFSAGVAIVLSSLRALRLPPPRGR